jgi:hypothetical protein
LAERTLADPLSGAEIKAIILDEIEKRLNGDCTLGNDLAYAGFTAKFEIKVSFVRSLVKESLVWGTAATAAPEGVETEVEKERTVAEDAYTSAAPDVERQEHNLPIPVLVQTPTGPVRQRVHIERKKSFVPIPPKGK